MSASASSVNFRGTPLGPSELSWLQHLLDGDEPSSQVEVARRACERFGWQRPNGAPPIMSFSVFLRRLASRGVLRLAPRQKVSTLHPDNDREELLRALGPVAGMVECQPSGPLLVRPVAPEEWDGFRLHLQRYHYLGFDKPVGESICYVASLGAEVVALLVWGAAVLHNGPRDRFLGWDAATRARNLLYVVNNRRYLVLPWIRQPHLASRVLGANLRRLSRDWSATYGHPVVLAETFIDSARFRGSCYRASNWHYLGETLGFSRTPQRGFAKNGRPKSSFVFPLHRHAARALRGEIPFPSREQAPHPRDS